MNKTIGALRTILTHLHRKQSRAWSPQRRQKNISDKVQKTWEQLSQSWWPPLKEKELEELLSGSDELHMRISDKKIFYLPPLERKGEFVPAMCMECDIDNNRESLKLRIMLVRHNEETNSLQGIGFRLESPQGSGQSRHDFYHMQLIKGFRTGRDVEDIPWLPDSQLSFPILAKSPITMVLSLLITLYGKNYCLEFYNEHSLHKADIKKYMSELNEWINWPDFK